ncbi:MAG TPA: hypothetical protein P5556_01710 [Candidatus Gastranaerophilales bacterium]|nr:hypothetical protein [Candidatus Gastranaerophilales bacterium]
MNMECESWLENLSMKDLPTEDIKIMADFYGIDFALKLMLDMPGINITIPGNGIKKIRNNYICRNYDGTRKSRLALALECKVTENYIKKLIWKNKQKENDNQVIA